MISKKKKLESLIEYLKTKRQDYEKQYNEYDKLLAMYKENKTKDILEETSRIYSILSNADKALARFEVLVKICDFMEQQGYLGEKDETQQTN